jgi:hypothetical protein
MVIVLSDCYTEPQVKAAYTIDPTTGAEMNLEVNLTFTEDELRLAVSKADDVTSAQVQAMNEVMAIAQQLSIKREEVRVARHAYQATLSKLDLKPGQDMTPDIALAMSREMTAQLMPFLLHRMSLQRRPR